MNEVHFLIRPDSGKHGLLYPSEIDTKNYVAFGAFYLTATGGSQLEQKYTFKAILGEDLILTTLVKLNEQENFYIVKITSVQLRRG